MKYVCQNQFFSAVLTHWGTAPVTHRLWGYFFYTRVFYLQLSLFCVLLGRSVIFFLVLVHSSVKDYKALSEMNTSRKLKKILMIILIPGL